MTIWSHVFCSPRSVHLNTYSTSHTKMVTMQLIIASPWKTSRTAVSSADTKQLASSSLCCHSTLQKQGWEPGAAELSSSTLMRGWSTSTKVLMFVCLSVTQRDYWGGTGLVFNLWKMCITESSLKRQAQLNRAIFSCICTMLFCFKEIRAGL